MVKNLRAVLVLLLVMGFSGKAQAVFNSQYNFTPDSVTTEMNISTNGVAIGKSTTRASAALDVTGSANVSGVMTAGSFVPSTSGFGTMSGFTLTYGLTAATAAFSGGITVGGTEGVTGRADFAAGVQVASFTVTGNTEHWGTVKNLGASTMSGGVVGPLIMNSGSVRPYVRTIAQLMAITPVVGDVYSCSDCTNTYTLVVGTGAVVGGFRMVGSANGPQ